MPTLQEQIDNALFEIKQEVLSLKSRVRALEARPGTVPGVTILAPTEDDSAQNE